MSMAEHYPMRFMGGEQSTKECNMSNRDSDCLFCKIVAGDIPSDIVYESDSSVAFRDLNPQAPTHLLIIPRKHIATINDIDAADTSIVGS